MRLALLASLLLALPAPSVAEVREQAVVDLRFDELGGTAKDSATAGEVEDQAELRGGATRVPSPFWNQRGGRAVRIEKDRRQFVAIPDGADVDRPEAVSVALLFVNLLPEDAERYHGLIAKRSATAPNVTNYGINYQPKADSLQLYVNSGSGYRVVRYPVKTTVGTRRLVHLVATWEVTDAPGTDADEDRDDVRVRLFVNGQVVKPATTTAGFVEGNDGWLTDIDPNGLINNEPLTIGSTNPTEEHTDGVVDEVQVFAKALEPAEVATLFREVAGDDGPELAKREAAPPAAAPVPEIATITPPVWRIGETNRVVVTGKYLADGKLLIPGFDVEQKTVQGSNAGRLIVDVTPKAWGPTRIPVRVATSLGVSNLRPVSLGVLPVSAVTEATIEKPATLPAALYGMVAGAQSVRVPIVGRAGQRLVADVEGRRLGAGFSPVVEVKTDRGTPLAIEWSKVELGGDTRAEVELPADGVYLVEVHDLTYKAPGRNDFVLRVGEGREIAAPANEVSPEGRLADEGSETIDARFTEATHVPLFVRGTLGEPGEEDRLLLDVTPGQTLDLELRGRAIDSPIDGVLAILAEPGGRQLALSQDDGANRDPKLSYKIPADAKQIVIAVRDLHGRGGPAFDYAVQVLPANQPDFSLAIEDRAVTLPSAGNAVVRLNVTRQRYNGPIALRVEGDDSITLVPNRIPAGLSGTTFVTLQRSDGGAETGSETIAIIGESEGLEPPLVRPAVVRDAAGDVHFAASNRRLPVTTTAAAPLTIAVEDLPPAYFRGAIANPRVHVTRPDGDAAYPVRITLLTNEPPRPVDPKDPKKGNKPVVRSESGVVLHPSESAGDLRVLVPLDVAVGAVDAVIRAEIVRHAYSNDVLATAFSAPFRLPVQPALTATVDQASLGFPAAEPTTIRGEIARTAGFEGAVLVDATGLPGGWTSGTVTVAAGETAFAVPVMPAKPDVKVDPKEKADPKLRVRLADGGRALLVPIGLKVTIGKPEAAPKPDADTKPDAQE